MMLRTTISRLKKVCSVVPRILRGDQCSATVLSAEIRKAHKSTKATGDGEKASTEKSNDVPDYKFSSAPEFKIDDQFRKKIDEAAGLTAKTDKKNDQPLLIVKLPLTHRERCQKIIDEAFGNASTNDDVLGEQYFSHTVNLEDTRRKIQESEKARLKLQERPLDNPLLPDNRSQYSIFKMPRELNANDENRGEIIVTDSAPAREPDLSKNLENVKGTAEEILLVEDPNITQAKEDLCDKCVNNPGSIERKALCDDDVETIEVIKDERKPYLYQKVPPARQLPWFLRAKTESEPNPHDKEDVNDNQESVYKKPLFNDDAETIKLVKDENDLHQEATASDQPHTPHVLNTTTAKEEEELLTQKLETIEETPVVEAHKPKLEGFNVTPRVLGNEPTLNCKKENNQDKSFTMDFPEALDEVSKRCLNCPLSQIDEMLINEMEKLGMTFRSAHKAPSARMEDDLVQMDVLNKQPISAIADQEMLSESSNLEDKENERATDSRIPEENEQNEALRKSGVIFKPTKEDAKDILYPEHIRIQIEPLPCKSEEYNLADDYNSPTTLTCYYLPPTLRPAGIKQEEEIEETLPNSRIPILYNQIKGTLSLDEPIHKGTLSETPNNPGNLTATHVLGHDHKASASKYENVHQMDEVEHYGRTPTQQATTGVQEELQEDQTAADRLFVKVPHANSRLPGENCNKKSEYSPTADNITQQCSKPESDPEKANLPEEILKEHTLDPYYVLTCNETCPISPGSSTSRNHNIDFVDTTETLYMKKNVCESLRPKPQPIVKSADMSSDKHARPNVIELGDQPEIRCTSVPGAIESVPKVGEENTLSALLKKVRKRSRFEFNEAQSGLDVQAVGKCGSKSPRCQPTGPRSPPTEPIPRPTFGLPKLKRGPPMCRPVKKPSNKCSSCTTNDGGNYPVMPNVLDEAEVCDVISKVNLSDEIINRLQNLGGVLRQAKSNIEILLAKDYEPWAPIPSWKIPQNTEKKKWRPGYHGLPPCVDGCPVFPKARASMNPSPPCNLKPCEGFPKRRSFTMLDCFTISLGETKVYDLGEF